MTRPTRRPASGETRRCGIPAMTLPPCDLEWGHDGDMHSNEGDGFYADRHLAEHRRRRRVLAHSPPRKAPR